jgi:hypothetical protein
MELDAAVAGYGIARLVWRFVVDPNPHTPPAPSILKTLPVS